MLKRLKAFTEQTSLLAFLGLPVIHFYVAQIAIAMSLENGMTSVWPSSAIYLAAVLWLGNRILPTILIGELIVNISLFNPILVGVGISLVDLLEPFSAVYLINRILQNKSLFDRSQNVFKFASIIIVAPLCSSTPGTMILSLGGISPWTAFGQTWLHWWLGDFISMLVFAPVLLNWIEPAKPSPYQPPLRIAESVLVLSLAIGISHIAFGQGYPVEYMLLPLLVWAAFRLVHWQVTLLIAIVSVIAIWGTVHGVGSFVRESVNESLVLLQSFVGVLALTTLTLAAVITEKSKAEAELQQAKTGLEERVEERTAEVQQTLQELRQTQALMVQNEKMSSLGQLVAGVAHEINNPVNFIHGNLTHIQGYTQDLLRLINLYRNHYPEPALTIQQEIEAMDLEFLTEDAIKLLKSMSVGTERIREIVLSLRNFSRLDESELKTVDIHEGIDSTLMILQNRWKPKPHASGIQIVREYGVLPLVECYAGQLNQVFMNLLTNAIDALEERDQHRTEEEIQANPSSIHIQTAITRSQWISICVSDNGPGIPEAIQAKLFDPFFTTKPVGQGTGLGLSISYKIIAEKHKGKLSCYSALGKGADFVVELPISH
ncbi:MAG: hypothetical protein HC772_03250 [Leptolyngbyaceae cyanobacterium CRU_2_3]|nr:hypothetical protein [Leptolyngbyaceae cyanobacterium CRU_2_3]